MRLRHRQPHSTESEQAILGGLLIDPSKIVEVMATVRPEEFFDPVHRRIFQAMMDLHDQSGGFDLLTVTGKLEDCGELQSAGGSAYLATLTTIVPTAASVDRYAERIKDKATHRAVIAAGQAIQELGQDEKLDPMDVIERAEQQILALSRKSATGKPQHIADLGSDAYERYARLHESGAAEGPQAVRTGLPDLDRMIDDLEPGALVVIAARPSMGKTSLALTIARNVAGSQGRNVAMFSLEMNKRSLMDRIISGLLGVETWRLKKGKLTDDEFRHMGKLFDGLKQHPIYIDDDSDTTIANIRSKARRQQLEHGLDLLIVDYLQLIEVHDRAAGENRTQQVSHIARSLKNLARELACPVIALSQLSRAVENRPGNIPQLSDLRESGAIEQDADIVLMLYREDMYEEDSDRPGVTDVYVRKNRNGPAGRVSLYFDAQRMSFALLEKRAGELRAT